MDVQLVMFKADGSRRDFHVRKERTLVGRQNTCDLRIPLSAVSREHCEVVLDGEDIKLRDLGSSNGTYHNNLRVQEVTLRPGDEVVIGPVVFKVVIDGDPAEVDPVRTILHSQESGSVDVPIEASEDMEELQPIAEVDDEVTMLTPSSDPEPGDVLQEAAPADDDPFDPMDVLEEISPADASDDGMDPLAALAEVAGDVEPMAELAPADDALEPLEPMPIEDEAAPAPPAAPAAAPAEPDTLPLADQASSAEPAPPADEDILPLADDDDPLAAMEALADGGDDAAAPDIDLDDPIAALEAMANSDGDDDIPMLAPDDEEKP